MPGGFGGRTVVHCYLCLVFGGRGNFPCTALCFVGIVTEEIGLATVEVHADVGIERLSVPVLHAGDVDGL